MKSSIYHKEWTKRGRADRNYEHYSEGRRCKKCSKPITNGATTCLLCTLTKDVCLDQKTKRYRERNPEKVRARKKIYQEIRVGRMKRLHCEVCGNSKSEAHHDDYSKLLEVTWLCKRHHVEADKRTKEKFLSPGSVCKDWTQYIV